MKFQNEKKELWRYASKNLTAPACGTTRQQPLPHRLPQQRHPHMREIAMTAHSLQPTLLGCYDDYGESSTLMTTMSRQEQVSTPPPPYNSVLELDGSTASQDYHLMFRQHQMHCTTEGEIETSVSETDTVTSYKEKQVANRDGCNYANTGDVMLVTDYETSTSSNCQLMVDLQKKTRHISMQSTIPPNPPVVETTTATSSTTSFAATAVKILRNCCGGSFSGNLSTNNCSYQPEQYFNTLIKQLKSSQITLLLKAVKSRYDPATPNMPATSSSHSTSHCSISNNQTNCILIRRTEILGEEPYVIACRLFFWQDLKNSSQLKRLPVCPNERDPVYICCNPLHWCRILETETAPPPYQNQKMNRLEGGNTISGVNSTTFESTDLGKIGQNNSDVLATVPESVTTDGEDRRSSSNWCEVAYWEMSQRVGERYPAKTPTINIFSDRPYTNDGTHRDGMCLRDLIEKRTTLSSDDVQYMRQKIGLGVVLSQESDGVWLFNRSTVPVFVYSPTLTDTWFRVCRVEPGDCLRAFDKFRAESVVYSTHFPGYQTGPIDKFSMRISFGKGWGVSYKRPDITLCPCWLEVLFKPQR